MAGFLQSTFGFLCCTQPKAVMLVNEVRVLTELPTSSPCAAVMSHGTFSTSNLGRVTPRSSPTP